MAFDLNTWGQQYGLTDAQKASLQAVMGSDDFVQKTRAYNMMYGSDNADANRALDAAKQLGILNQTLSGAGASPSGGAGQTYGTWNVANTGNAGSLDATPWGTTGAAPRGVMNTPTGVAARPSLQGALQSMGRPFAPNSDQATLDFMGRVMGGKVYGQGQPYPGATFGRLEGNPEGYGLEGPLSWNGDQGRWQPSSLAPGVRQTGPGTWSRPGGVGALSGIGDVRRMRGTPGFDKSPQGRALGYGALPQMLAQRQRPGYQAPAGSMPYGYGALDSLFGPSGRPTPYGDTRYRGDLQKPALMQPIGQPVTYQNGGGYQGRPIQPGATFGQPNPYGATPLGAGGFGIRTLGG